MSNVKKQLLLGCGNSREKLLYINGENEWGELTTLDFYPECNPDVVHDLMELPLPFEAESFDEIHTYEVLEHTGRQGDWRFFFAQFTEFWRILKPEGLLFAKCPSPKSVWAWGDPSHSRVMQKEQLVFLSQAEYEAQVGKTPMSDFRHVYKADFEIVWTFDNDLTFAFTLKKLPVPRSEE